MTPHKQPTARGTNLIGKRIRIARQRLKPRVTIKDFAARLSIRGLDLDRPTVTRIETGKRYLRDYEIKVIAKTLGVSVAWLFNEE